MFIPLVEY